jgi:hypothetical protein
MNKLTTSIITACIFTLSLPIFSRAEDVAVDASSVDITLENRRQHSIILLKKEIGIIPLDIEIKGLRFGFTLQEELESELSEEKQISDVILDYRSYKNKNGDTLDFYRNILVGVMFASISDEVEAKAIQKRIENKSHSKFALTKTGKVKEGHLHQLTYRYETLHIGAYDSVLLSGKLETLDYDVCEGVKQSLSDLPHLLANIYECSKKPVPLDFVLSVNSPKLINYLTGKEKQILQNNMNVEKKRAREEREKSANSKAQTF